MGNFQVFGRQLETGENYTFKPFLTQRQEIVESWNLVGKELKSKKKNVKRIFDILILGGDIKLQKSSCLPELASCLPSGKTSQNILHHIFAKDLV